MKFTAKNFYSSELHWDIIDAVSRGRIEEAGELMRCHVEKAQQALILQIQKDKKIYLHKGDG